MSLFTMDSLVTVKEFKVQPWEVLLSTIIMSLLFLHSFIKGKHTERFKTFNLKWDLDLSKLIKYGSATGAEMFLAFTCFSTFVALFHSYGSAEAISATIALNWEIIVFMPLKISIGLMSLVGRYMGSQELEKVYRAIKSSLLLTILTMVLVLFFSKTEALIAPFIPDGVEADILPLASVMLKIVCLYCISNRINLTISGTLRASGDTRAVMSIVLAGDLVMIMVSYYLIKA